MEKKVMFCSDCNKVLFYQFFTNEFNEIQNYLDDPEEEMMCHSCNNISQFVDPDKVDSKIITQVFISEAGNELENANYHFFTHFPDNLYARLCEEITDENIRYKIAKAIYEEILENLQ